METRGKTIQELQKDIKKMQRQVLRDLNTWKKAYHYDEDEAREQTLECIKAIDVFIDQIAVLAICCGAFLSSFTMTYMLISGKSWSF